MARYYPISTSNKLKKKKKKADLFLEAVSTSKINNCIIVQLIMCTLEPVFSNI